LNVWGADVARADGTGCCSSRRGPASATASSCHPASGRPSASCRRPCCRTLCRPRDTSVWWRGWWAHSDARAPSSAPSGIIGFPQQYPIRLGYSKPGLPLVKAIRLSACLSTVPEPFGRDLRVPRRSDWRARTWCSAAANDAAPDGPSVIAVGSRGGSFDESPPPVRSGPGRSCAHTHATCRPES